MLLACQVVQAEPVVKGDAVHLLAIPFANRMTRLNSNAPLLHRRFWITCCAILLTGYGGTKVLKEPVPLAVQQPLASASSEGTPGMTNKLGQ